jgi:hypothetical protein
MMQNLLYYDEDGYSRPLKLTKNSIISALNAIYAGKGVPKHSENILERFARVRIFHLCLNLRLFFARQSVNNKVLALEAYVKTHIKTTLFGIVLFIVLIFYSLRYEASYCSGL